MTVIRRRWQSKMNKENETASGKKCDLRRQEQEWLEKVCLLIFIYEFIIKSAKSKSSSTKDCIAEVCSELFSKKMKLERLRNSLSPLTNCYLRRQEQEWLEKVCLLIFIYEFLIKSAKSKSSSTKDCIAEVCSELFSKKMKLERLRNALSPLTNCYAQRKEEAWLEYLCLLIFIYEIIINSSKDKINSTMVCKTEVCNKLFGEEMKVNAIRDILAPITSHGMEGKSTENEKRVYSELLCCVWKFFKNTNIGRDGKCSNSLDSIDLENENNLSDVKNYAESENQEPVETDERKSFISNNEITNDTKQDKKVAQTHDNDDLKRKSHKKCTICNPIRDKKLKKDLKLGFIQCIKAKGCSTIFGHSSKKTFASNNKLSLFINSASRRLMRHKGFQTEMNKLLSKYDTPLNPELNVLLLHSKEGSQSAKKLSTTYRHYFNIFADCELEGVYSSDPIQNRKKAITWANCVIIVDPSHWLEDATDVSTSAKRSSNSFFSRYQFSLLQSIFVYNDSLNLKVLYVNEDGGCNCTHGACSEIGSPISLYSERESFEDCVQTFVVKAEMIKSILANRSNLRI